MNNSQHTALWWDNKAVQWLFGLATFSLIFVYHASPLALSDFWWHLNTGRWIWSHGALPVDDPFLFTSPVPLDARASMILRGYPLSQLLFFGVYSVAGAYGLLVLKSLLLTLFYFLVWNLLRRSGLHSVLACLAISVLPLLFFRFDELRPQVFSFIFTLLLLQLIQQQLARARRGEPVRWHVAALLPVTMLLWANLHPGYVIGIGMLLVYLASEWLGSKWLARHDLTRSDRLPAGAFRRWAITVLAALALSFCNPGGVAALWVSFSEFSGPFVQVIDEFMGTLRYFDYYGAAYIGYGIVALAVIPCVALAFKWRQLSPAHIVLLAGFVAAGILSFRFSLLMVVMVLIFASAYFASALNRWALAARGWPLLILWCVATGALANAALGRTALSRAPLESGVLPAGAADYLRQARPSGNLYNPYEYGGYLSWQLYPQQAFIDQRTLSWATYEEDSRIWRGDYPDVFGKYRIGAAIQPVLERETGKPSRLVAGLLNDEQWEVGYYDRRDIVFIRGDINGHLGMLDKQQVVMDILQLPIQ